MLLQNAVAWASSFEASRRPQQQHWNQPGQIMLSFMVAVVVVVEMAASVVVEKKWGKRVEGIFFHVLFSPLISPLARWISAKHQPAAAAFGLIIEPNADDNQRWLQSAQCKQPKQAASAANGEKRGSDAETQQITDAPGRRQCECGSKAGQQPKKRGVRFLREWELP
jgi:hypothetical protein